MAEWIRVEDDDPNRCQAVHRNYQCPYRAVGTRDKETGKWEGSAYCARHGGHLGAKAAEAASMRLYLSALWQDKIGHQADHPKIKTLSEEIGILRMVLVRKLDGIKNDMELAMNAGGITELIREITKTVKIWDQIQQNNKNTLDEAKAKAFIDEVVSIVGMYVKEPEILQNISEEMLSGLDKLLGNQ